MGPSGVNIDFSATPAMPGTASGTKWLGTTMPALPKEQPLRAGEFRSMTVTE